VGFTEHIKLILVAHVGTPNGSTLTTEYGIQVYNPVSDRFVSVPLKISNLDFSSHTSYFALSVPSAPTVSGGRYVSLLWFAWPLVLLLLF
jgi:hypothetical protein